nr:hypothetical protein [Tanacetum cinerariifolium]
MAFESFKGATNIERNGIKGSDLMVFSFATIVAATTNFVSENKEIDHLSMILSTNQTQVVFVHQNNKVLVRDGYVFNYLCSCSVGFLFDRVSLKSGVTVCTGPPESQPPPPSPSRSNIRCPHHLHSNTSLTAITPPPLSTTDAPSSSPHCHHVNIILPTTPSHRCHNGSRRLHHREHLLAAAVTPQQTPPITTSSSPPCNHHNLTT